MFSLSHNAMSPKHYIIVEHRSPAYELALKERITGLLKQQEALTAENRRLTALYGAEVQYNAALVDILRAHDIPFRPLFDHETRFRLK